MIRVIPIRIRRRRIRRTRTVRIVLLGSLYQTAAQHTQDTLYLGFSLLFLRVGGGFCRHGVLVLFYALPPLSSLLSSFCVYTMLKPWVGVECVFCALRGAGDKREGREEEGKKGLRQEWLGMKSVSTCVLVILSLHMFLSMHCTYNFLS